MVVGNGGIPYGAEKGGGGGSQNTRKTLNGEIVTDRILLGWKFALVRMWCGLMWLGTFEYFSEQFSAVGFA